MKNFRWDKKYLHWGITAFCVVACAIIFYMLLRYVGTLKTGLDSLMNILSPFIWGLVIAYLLAPLLDFYQRKLFTPLMHRWGVKKTDGEGEPKGARALSVTLAEITLIA
jgi:predicted PurR-regulated permease PerM